MLQLAAPIRSVVGDDRELSYGQPLRILAMRWRNYSTTTIQTDRRTRLRRRIKSIKSLNLLFMIISTLKVSNLPRFRGALNSLKHPSRCICNTTRMTKPDHSERTATEPRDPVRIGDSQKAKSEHLLIQWGRSTVAPHGHSQAHRRGQPLNPHLPPSHPTLRGKHQGKAVRIIIPQVSMRFWYLCNPALTSSAHSVAPHVLVSDPGAL